jgi:hypothetical protein
MAPIEEPVRALAALIREKQIPDLVSCLGVEDMFRKVADVSELMHTFGLNLRYLGEVASKVENVRVRVILEREALIRSAKRVLNRHMRSCTVLHLS